MFKRIAALFRGFLSLFIGGLEKNNPEVLLANEKENLRKQISEFNKGLAAHAGLVENLMSRVKKLQAEEIELKAKTKALLQAGNRDLAAQYAQRFQGVDKEEDDLRGQLEAAEVRYKEMIRARDVAVKNARERIEKINRGVNDMKIQKATAELNEMAAGMINSIGGSGDTLNRLEEMVEEERTKAAGRARVAKDSVDMADIDLKEGEQKAMGELALAEFAAAEGIQLEPKLTGDTVAAPAESVGGGIMGPVAQ